MFGTGGCVGLQRPFFLILLILWRSLCFEHFINAHQSSIAPKLQKPLLIGGKFFRKFLPLVRRKNIFEPEYDFRFHFEYFVCFDGAVREGFTDNILQIVSLISGFFLRSLFEFFIRFAQPLLHAALFPEPLLLHPSKFLNGIILLRHIGIGSHVLPCEPLLPERIKREAIHGAEVYFHETSNERSISESACSSFFPVLSRAMPNAFSFNLRICSFQIAIALSNLMANSSNASA